MCSFEKIKNEKIFLPQNNGSIDFDFMEHYIAELEAERIAELEAYLTATGLKDYTLTEEERRIVDNYNNLKWGTYNLKYLSSNPQPIGFSGILLAKRQNSFYCTYFLHNRNVADTKSPYPIKRLEVIRWFNQKSMVFNQSLS